MTTTDLHPHRADDLLAHVSQLPPRTITLLERHGICTVADLRRAIVYQNDEGTICTVAGRLKYLKGVGNKTVNEVVVAMETVIGTDPADAQDWGTFC